MYRTCTHLSSLDIREDLSFRAFAGSWSSKTGLSWAWEEPRSRHPDTSRPHRTDQLERLSASSALACRLTCQKTSISIYSERMTFLLLLRSSLKSSQAMKLPLSMPSGTRFSVLSTFNSQIDCYYNSNRHVKSSSQISTIKCA